MKSDPENIIHQFTAPEKKTMMYEELYHLENKSYGIIAITDNNSSKFSGWAERKRRAVELLNGANLEKMVAADFA